MFQEYKSLIKDGMLSDLEAYKNLYEVIGSMNFEKISQIESQINNQINVINARISSKDCRKAVVYCLIFIYISQYKYKIHDDLFIATSEDIRNHFIRKTVNFFQKFDTKRDPNHRNNIGDRDVRSDCFKAFGIDESGDWNIPIYIKVRIMGICQLPDVDDFIKVLSSYIFDRGYYISPYELIDYCTDTTFALDFPAHGIESSLWRQNEIDKLDWSKKNYDTRINQEKSKWLKSKKWIHHFEQKKAEHIQQINAYLDEMKDIHKEVVSGYQYLMDWQEELKVLARLSMVTEVITAFKNDVPLNNFLLTKGLSQLEILKSIR